MKTALGLLLLSVAVTSCIQKSEAETLAAVQERAIPVTAVEKSYQFDLAACALNWQPSQNPVATTIDRVPVYRGMCTVRVQPDEVLGWVEGLGATRPYMRSTPEIRGFQIYGPSIGTENTGTYNFRIERAGTSRLEFSEARPIIEEYLAAHPEARVIKQVFFETTKLRPVTQEVM